MYLISLSFNHLCFIQPLFPGDSAVDQLVEIIKVCYLQDFVSRRFFVPAELTYVTDEGFRNTNKGRDQVHESKLHRVQISSDQSSPMGQGQ